MPIPVTPQLQYDDLQNENLDLCKRVRCARMKSGNIKYWHNQLQNSKDLSFTLLVFFTWCTPRTIIALLPKLSEVVPTINELDFLRLINSLLMSNRNYVMGKYRQNPFRDYIKKNKVSDPIIILISSKFEFNDRKLFISEFISDFHSQIDVFKNYKLDSLVGRLLSSPLDKQLFAEIKNLYCDIESVGNTYSRRRLSMNIKLPLNIAMEIMSDCKSYPGYLVSLAEISCRINASQKVMAVGEIAKVGNWFGE